MIGSHPFAVGLVLLAALLASSAATAAGPLQAALLSPGPVSDAGWNAAGYEGLKLVERELGAKVVQVETKTPSEFEENFRAFGEKGFDVVFAHGAEYQDPADQLHARFKRTVYVVTAGIAAREPNVAPLVIRLEQPAYLCGVLAGKMSKTGVAGCVGGMELPFIRWCFDGFRDGFLSARPDGKVLTAYIGNWEDAGAAKEATRAQLARGADFVFHNADAAGLGVFQAVKEAAGKTVYAFGSNRDQNAVMPEVVLGSAVVDIPKAMLSVAREIAGGNFHAREIDLDLANDEARLVLNPALSAHISPEASKAVEEARRRILGGQVKFREK